MTEDFKPKSSLQKWVAIALAVVTAVIVLPLIAKLMVNMLIGGIVLVVLLFLGWNYQMLWSMFESISWSLTKSYIKSNKLEVIRQYINAQHIKAKEIKSTIENVGGTRVALQREIDRINQAITANVRQVQILQENNSSEMVIDNVASKIGVDEETLKNLSPQLESILNNENLLKEMYVLLVHNIEKLEYRLDGKVREYETLKKVAESSGKVSEFIKGRTKESQMFDESLRQMEQEVSLYTSKVEQFSTDFQPVIEAGTAQKGADAQRGLELVEKYKKELKV